MNNKLLDAVVVIEKIPTENEFIDEYIKPKYVKSFSLVNFNSNFQGYSNLLTREEKNNVLLIDVESSDGSSVYIHMPRGMTEDKVLHYCSILDRSLLKSIRN